MAVRDFKYLIIGGGMTGDAAARGIRGVDPEGTIGMISNEPNPPYNRPPLSKGLWKKTKLENIWRGTEKLGIDLFLGRTAMKLDAANRQVTDNLGDVYTYQKLLLATGGIPNRLPHGSTRTIYFRYFSDYTKLRTLADTRQRFAVIGGGFIGSEIAAALRMHGKEVTMIFPEEGIGARLFPKSLSQFVTRYYREKGVHVLECQSVSAIEDRGEEMLVRTGSGEELIVDGVVAGLGIKPNLDLAKQAGLKIDNGIVVDAALRTSNEKIYAAGDVISFYNSSLGNRMRVEHEEHANQSGLLAGQSMAGQVVNYDFLPVAYSDLFDLGYESVGELNPALEIVEDWQEPYQKGVVYYTKKGRVRGVLLWNVWSCAPDARELIASPGPYKSSDLIGKIG